MQCSQKSHATCRPSNCGECHDFEFSEIRQLEQIFWVIVMRHFVIKKVLLALPGSYKVALLD